MPENKLIPRSLDVVSSEIPLYINFLEKFLGVSKITQRLEKINKTIQMEKGTAYRNYWLLPNVSFWMGLQEARQHVPVVSLDLENTLEIAAKLKVLYNSMSPRVRSDLCNRILKADYLAPIFFEIDIAAHFWQLGYEIWWADPADQPGVPIPEFTLTNGKHKIEVECKLKRVDAGRKLPQEHFYRLVDKVIAPLSNHGYTGRIDIVIPDRMPVKDGWKNHIIEAIHQLLSTGNSHTKLNDGTEIKIDIRKLEGIVIPAEEVIKDAQKNKQRHSQLAIFWGEANNTLINPLIFELKSQTGDRFLEDILDTLKDASRQFTGENAALICCFIPGIDSFDGLGQDSALFRILSGFFEGKSNIFSILFASDVVRTVNYPYISKTTPGIRLDNPFYDERFGPIIQIFEKN